ncbi:MAG TPA: GntG family PLP-dependent aldolase [Acidimicrobiales bacterium]|nr:GntG family PLP-dependent aldolase [Acidimicrobiales bacterium]
MSPLVDLRSDTVTRPTPEMRRAMAEAEVGDDGYGEDPTVNALEAEFAERLGMQAALYVPSGVMANQVALRVLAPPGTTVLVGRRQHLVAYENGAGAGNSQAQLVPLDDDDGLLDPNDILWAKEAAFHHHPSPGMVAVENTHMASGGRVCHPEAMKTLVAASGDLPVYVDGARIFNAEVAAGIPAARLVEGAAAAMACLSKGLCAPVGSVLAGPEDTIAAARVERHRLGGAMRQAGVIAAAGLVALRTMVDRLAEDHRRAHRLAEAVAERWPGSIDPAEVATNCVVFPHPDTAALLAHLEAAGVLGGTIEPGVMRLMTHHDVDDEGVERTLVALADAPR